MEIIKKDRPQRPLLLWFLAICTMLDEGMSILCYAMFMLFPNMMQMATEKMLSMPFYQDDIYKEAFTTYLSVESWQYALLLLASAAIFVGALIMLVKMKQLGFHIYTIGQIVNFCIINFVIGGKLAAMSNIASWIMQICIIVLFATLLPYMKPLQEEEDNELS